MARSIRNPRAAITELCGWLASAGPRPEPHPGRPMLDPGLRSIAELGSAGFIGCTWRVHLGYVSAHRSALDLAKAREVPRWRESEVFSDLERDVLEYAEAMSTTPLAVTDWMTEKLVDQLGEGIVLELTEVIARENMRSRFHAAAGLQSRGHVATDAPAVTRNVALPPRGELRLVRPT